MTVGEKRVGRLTLVPHRLESRVGNARVDEHASPDERQEEGMDRLTDVLVM
jgi:hypothetical protein